MLSIKRYKNGWMLVISHKKEEFPLVVNDRLPYIKERMSHITCQINNHENPQKVKKYYFNKAKQYWNKLKKGN